MRGDRLSGEARVRLERQHGRLRVEPSALEFIPRDGTLRLPRPGKRAAGSWAVGRPHTHDGLWFDIGRREDYERAILAWEDGADPFLNDPDR